MNKNPVNGMRDILPNEMKVRNYVLKLIRETYQSFGFTEIETPCVESIENLQGKNGGENEKLIFKVMKRGEKLNLETAKTENDLVDSGLRYDLTVPLSRYYSNHQADLPKPFKALQIGRVFRAERPQKGRFREFYQCDIDIFGDGTNLAETELILAMTTLLQKIGFKGYEIRINDRRILKAMASFSGLPETEYDEVFIALDKMDKIGLEGVTKELLALGMTESDTAAVLGFFEASGTKNGTEGLDALAGKLGEVLDPSVVSNMKEIFALVNAAKSEGFELIFDPTLVRGMGYYTGPIFEISVPQFGSSVGGGGRYDEMVKKFCGQETPACGFSVGFERIISILMDENFQVPDAPEKVAVLLEKGLSEEKKAAAFKDAQALRAEGKCVAIAMMAKNKKFQKDQLAADGYTDIREVYEREF